MVFILISNALILCTILYEFSYLGEIAKLSPERYFKIQLVKSIYFLLIVLVTLISGSGLPMDEKTTGAARFWAFCWKLAIFV
jgi:hypothetical protein